ncbi:RNA ligase family protein [Desulfofalx alkaliphila]|uniref:ATP-dependent DNA ligase n=1 Tax=Desulfofalx alkaliphila TaxID=105483 RepID=UPI0006920AA8|nr:RNA ligase family protein [Desulfofalx alkaliphila]
MLSFPVKPMLLKTINKPFNDDNYLFEWKVDGVRCLLHFSNGQTRLQSRNGKDCSAAFPELLAPDLAAEEAILDGEITVLTEGKPNFEGTMSRYLSSKNAVNISKTQPAYYLVWDILSVDGQPLLDKSLLERKEVLGEALKDSANIKKIDFIERDGLSLWEAIKKQELEGMVAKHKNSRYLPGQRSSAWLKIKNWTVSEVNIFGYKPKDGYVLVGKGDKVQGHASGIGKEEKAALLKLLDLYGVKKADGIWLPAGIKGFVKYTNITPKGNFRDCTWVSFKT